MNVFTILVSTFLSASAFASTVTVPTTAFPLIPASAISCLAHKSAQQTGQAPVADVAPAYFRIPQITFNNNSDDTLVIALVRLSIPQAGAVCEYGGNALSALFPGPIDQEVAIAANSAVSTDCALYCGGISGLQESTTYEGKMEVFGIYRNKHTQEETPLKMNTSFAVQNY